ncbi:hypothetical protein C8Q74DRAFT_194153 [Fomes fomentarius]|nr:hypothetical protein C8Q74DRAFT_194153 [Fomes fomentarius]
MQSHKFEGHRIRSSCTGRVLCCGVTMTIPLSVCVISTTLVMHRSRVSLTLCAPDKIHRAVFRPTYYTRPHLCSLQSPVNTPLGLLALFLGILTKHFILQPCVHHPKRRGTPGQFMHTVGSSAGNISPSALAISAGPPFLTSRWR